MLYKSGAQESEPSLSQLTERRLTHNTHGFRYWHVLLTVKFIFSATKDSLAEMWEKDLGVRYFKNNGNV